MQAAVVPTQSSPYEILVCANAAYKKHYDEYLAKTIPTLKALEKTKIHGFRLLCIRNEKTGEIIVAKCGTRKLKQWTNQNLPNALGLIPQNIVDRVNKAIQEWGQKHGQIVVATGHSAAAPFLSRTPQTIYKVFFNGHIVDLPDKGTTLHLRTTDDLLTKIWGKRQCEAIGEGGHALDNFFSCIFPTTTWAHLSSRFYKSTESRWVLNDPEFSRLRQATISADQKIETYIEQTKDKQSSGSKRHIRKELKNLEFDLSKASHAERAYILRHYLDLYPDLKELPDIKQIINYEGVIGGLFTSVEYSKHASKHRDKESEKLMRTNIKISEEKLKPLYDSLQQQVQLQESINK